MALLQITRTDDAIRLEGEIDMSAQVELPRALEEAIASGTTVVDLSAVTFMDSTGLRAFLVTAGSLNGNGPLVLRQPSSAVRRLLDIALPTGAPGLVIE